MENGSVIALIICLSIIVIIAIVALSVIWLITFDAEARRQKIKNRIKSKVEETISTYDVLFENLKEKYDNRYKDLEEQIDILIEENKDLTEELISYKQQAIEDKEITVIEDVLDEEVLEEEE